jgi:hypothetical protein
MNYKCWCCGDDCMFCDPPGESCDPSCWCPLCKFSGCPGCCGCTACKAMEIAGRTPKGTERTTSHGGYPGIVHEWDIVRRWLTEDPDMKEKPLTSS